MSADAIPPPLSDWRARYALLRAVGDLVMADLDDDALLRRLADRLIDASGADGGFLIRVEPGAGEFTVLLARHYKRGDIARAEFEVSRTVIRRAIDKGRPVLVENAALLPPASQTRSISLLKLGSIIALPLRLPEAERPHAVIYLDRRRPGHRFTPDDLAALADVLEWTHRALAMAFAARRAGPAPGSGLAPRIRAQLIGGSRALDEVAAFIARAARSPANVLLRGETGTGKDLVAQLLHQAGTGAEGTAAQPFIAVNCAAIPAELLESELFGHEAGAFTGAREKRAGRFQEAGGGTLFLDEIGDLPLPLQGKLLRVVETRRFSPLGGRETAFRARLVTATHQPLEKMIAAGKFRQDLFYRLAVLELRLPPLRERREDLPALAGHFATQHARRLDRTPPRFSPAALRHLQRRAWPGNIRELSHLIERTLVFSDAALLEPADLRSAETDGLEAAPAAPLSAAELRQRRQQLVDDLDRQFVESLLRLHQGDVAGAARRAGLTRARLYQMIQRHVPDLVRKRAR
jgi:DNA-binding NtrC family response regulator